MNHQPPHHDADPRAPSPEEHRQLHPRIWIASLADYNAGYLHGAWIDATQDPHTLTAQAHDILTTSPTPGAEEWAIHDYDDFAHLKLSEHEPFEDISAIANGLAQHGPAFAAWTTLVQETTPPGTLDHHLLTQFEDHYLGSYMTTQQWIHDETTALGLEDTLDHTIPAALRPYVKIDYDGLAHELERTGDFTILNNPDGGIWVFRGL